MDAIKKRNFMAHFRSRIQSETSNLISVWIVYFVFASLRFTFKFSVMHISQSRNYAPVCVCVHLSCTHNCSFSTKIVTVRSQRRKKLYQTVVAVLLLSTNRLRKSPHHAARYNTRFRHKKGIMHISIKQINVCWLFYSLLRFFSSFDCICTHTHMCRQWPSQWK